MPEFTKGSPEELYSDHKELAAKVEEAQGEVEKLDKKRSEAAAEYQEAKEAGFASYQDDLEARPTGYGLAMERAKERAVEAQGNVNTQAEEADKHYRANEAAYHQEAAELDAQGIQNIAREHRNSGEEE